MRFESIFAGAAFVAAAMAQSLAINTFPSTGVVAGQTYEVTYSPADNIPTTFVLRQGASGNLNTIDTLTSRLSCVLPPTRPLLTRPQPLPLVASSPGLWPRPWPTSPTMRLRFVAVTRSTTPLSSALPAALLPPSPRPSTRPARLRLRRSRLRPLPSAAPFPVLVPPPP